MITHENILSHELIGLRTKITNSSNTHYVGLTGTIIDETKSMFILNTKKGNKMISKNQNTWKLIFGKNEFDLHGSLIEKRSFDRLGAKL